MAATTLFWAFPLSLKVSPAGKLSISIGKIGAAVGRPLVATTLPGVARSASRRAARQATYGNDGGYAGSYGAGRAAMAALASGIYAGGVYNVGAWDRRTGIAGADVGAMAVVAPTSVYSIPYYPTREIYARGGVPGSYYGPVCNPRFDRFCQ